MTMQVGSSENVFGVAVSSSLSHFRKKYRQAMGLTWQESSSSNICCTFCGAQQLLFTYRCTHCRTAYYCKYVALLIDVFSFTNRR